MYITCTATASLPLCQSIPVYHSNSGSTRTLRVLPLHHYPSVRVSQRPRTYHGPRATQCVLLPSLFFMPGYGLAVTLAVRVHYVYCHSPYLIIVCIIYHQQYFRRKFNYTFKFGFTSKGFLGDNYSDGDWQEVSSSDLKVCEQQ